MKTRNEIDLKYKWDLSCFVKNEEELKKNLKYLKENITEFKQFYGKLADKAMLKKYLTMDKEYNKVLYATSLYISNTLNTNTADVKYINYSTQLSYIGKELGEATAYIYPHMLDFSEEYLQELLSDLELKDYFRFFKDIARNKPHKISEYDSQFLSKMGMFLGSSEEVYDTLTSGEMTFDKAKDSSGQEHDVEEAEYSKLMDNSDRELRKNAFKSLMNGYGGKIRTFATTYTNDIHLDSFMTRLSKFNSLKQRSLFDEEVDDGVYNNLINNINKRVIVLQQIVETKAKHLKYNDMAYYDLFVTVVEEKKNYAIEEAVELVKDCTKILGEEYQQVLNQKFNENVIDFLPNKDKVTGAYSTSMYGKPSIVLMNFVEDYNSVSTLAHEIGHAMHSEFSNRNQPEPLADYVIFVAEVASTVNEILLNLHVSKTADEEQKKALAFELLDSVRSTIFRQTLFSEFEDYTHEQLENEAPLTYEDFNNKYYELNKKYYGENIILPDELKYEWSRIPHFYRPFYVYKYATGFVSALCIVQKLLTDKDYYKQYISFLKSGCTKPPVELLQDIGVDLTTDEPYNKAFEFVENILKTL